MSILPAAGREESYHEAFACDLSSQAIGRPAVGRYKKPLMTLWRSDSVGACNVASDIADFVIAL